VLSALLQRRVRHPDRAQHELHRLDLIPIIAGAIGAYGIANERRWAYYLAIVSAFCPFIFAALINSNHNPFGGQSVLTLVFEIALIALLLHTQSREYERVWFK
jgi:uncharacterized membrane protein (DUF2068 family)